MSKIVFFCIPAYGHTNPTLGVVRELTARGHEFRYYSLRTHAHAHRSRRRAIRRLRPV